MPISLRSDDNPVVRKLRLHNCVRQNGCDKCVCIESVTEYKYLGVIFSLEATIKIYNKSHGFVFQPYISQFAGVQYFYYIAASLIQTMQSLFSVSFIGIVVYIFS